MLASRNNGAEKDHPDDLSLAGDGFDTVIKAKAAVDSVPECRNKVSCADILAMATRDVIALVSFKLQKLLQNSLIDLSQIELVSNQSGILIPTISNKKENDPGAELKMLYVSDRRAFICSRVGKVRWEDFYKSKC